MFTNLQILIHIPRDQTRSALGILGDDVFLYMRRIISDQHTRISTPPDTLLRSPLRTVRTQVSSRPGTAKSAAFRGGCIRGFGSRLAV
jgi:hypothetical protein